jgi:hypothetical protein
MGNIHDNVSGATHSVPAEWVASRMVSWMMEESEGRPWWVTGLTPHGKFIHANFPESYFPKPERQAYAHHICYELNKQLHYGGTWLAGWLHGGNRFYLLWKDRDGDIQIPIDCDKPWHIIRQWPVDSWLNNANAAYETWFQIMEQIEANQDQTVKLAQDRPLN